MNVLVVDDDKITESCLKESLTKRGFQVQGVLNGEAALTALGTGTYDALVLDVYMPGIDGIEVLRKVRQLLPSRNLPVVIVTAGSVAKVTEQVREMPPAVVIAKPYEVAEIVNALNEWQQLRIS